MSSDGSKYIPLQVLLAVPIGYALLRQGPTTSATDPDLGQTTRGVEAATVPGPVMPVNLGSLERCGCKLAEATNYYQPDGCQLKERPSLVGVEGYLKTGDWEVDKRPVVSLGVV